MKLISLAALIILLILGLTIIGAQETSDKETTKQEASEEIIQIQKINLNDMTSEELTDTIPDFGRRMVREFFEYQPYISIQQFRREIGKYVNDEQVAFYEQFIYVPIDINESDAATLMQIKGITEEVAENLFSARPYESNDTFLETLSELLPDLDQEVTANFLYTEESKKEE